MTEMTDVSEIAHRNPPRGYKNIDLARIQMKKLIQSVDECSSDTPAFTLSSSRWLENAFYSREIIEEDYDGLMAKIKEQTRKFIKNCECLKQ